MIRSAQAQIGCCDEIARPVFAAFPQSPQCYLVGVDSFLTCDANWGKYVTLHLPPFALLFSVALQTFMPAKTAKILLGNPASPVWPRSRPLIVRFVESRVRFLIVSLKFT